MAWAGLEGMILDPVPGPLNHGDKEWELFTITHPHASAPYSVTFSCVYDSAISHKYVQ